MVAREFYANYDIEGSTQKRRRRFNGTPKRTKVDDILSEFNKSNERAIADAQAGDSSSLSSSKTGEAIRLTTSDGYGSDGEQASGTKVIMRAKWNRDGRVGSTLEGKNEEKEKEKILQEFSELGKSLLGPSVHVVAWSDTTTNNNTSSSSNNSNNNI